LKTIRNSHFAIRNYEENDGMNPEELKKRTKEFALRVLRFVNSMQRGRTEDILTKQLARAAASVGANYRAACRARSRADFVSKITIVEEEADETQYWLELLLDQSRVNKREIIDLLDEAKELTAIFTASGKTAKWGTLIS
jgi:four helix bundle protein